MVVPDRVERSASRVSAGRSRHAELKDHGASAGNRTRDLCFTRAPLYQLSY